MVVNVQQRSLLLFLFRVVATGFFLVNKDFRYMDMPYLHNYIVLTDIIGYDQLKSS